MARKLSMKNDGKLKQGVQYDKDGKEIKDVTVVAKDGSSCCTII